MYQMKGGIGYLWRFRAEHSPDWPRCCSIYLTTLGHTICQVRTSTLGNIEPTPELASYLLEITGSASAFTPFTITNPDPDTAITCVGDDCLGGTNDRSGWKWCKLEVRWKTSTYDPDTATFAADAVVEVRFQENVLVTRTGLTIAVVNQAAADFQVAFFPVSGDIDQVWILNDYVYATAANYTDDSMDTVVSSPALTFVDTFAAGLDAAWLPISGGFGGAVLPYWRSDTGKHESGGITHNNLDEDGTAVSGAFFTGYSGISQQFDYAAVPSPEPVSAQVPGTVPDCCDPPHPITAPDPVGTLAPWLAACESGGVVDSVADLADGEFWG